MADRIIKQDLIESYEEDYRRYANYLLLKRAFPNVRDGLKSVQKRILYAGFALVHATDKSVKTQKLASTVAGDLHPHGDKSISDALKPMTNWFEIPIPLLDGQGNWGGITGFSQAAPRYTESRLSKFSMENYFEELRESKDVVDWIETYSFDSKEPENLPCKIPILLINGSFGIAVGVKNLIPKHNINEVIDITVNLIRHPNAPVVLIPDQCQKCDIVDTNWKKISNTGEGKFIVRGRMEDITYKGYPALSIISTPDLVWSDNIKAKLNDLVADKKIFQIRKIIDESETKKGKPQKLCLIIQLKKGTDPQYIKDIIYKKCELQKTFAVNFEGLDGFTPDRFSYKSYLQYFIEYRRITKFRLYANKIQDIATRLDKINTYIKVIKSGKILEIAKMIAEYTKANDDALMEYLIKEVNLTDIQALFIMNTGLKKISKGNLQEYIDESNSLTKEYNKYLYLISDEKEIDNEIIKELQTFKRKYGKPRNCKIISEAELNNIPQGEFKLIITEKNFLKKLDIGSTMGHLTDDAPKFIMNVDNTKAILLFDNLGKVFRIDIHKIPLCDKNSNGIDIRRICKNATANINTIMYEPHLEDFNNSIHKYFITVLTRNGIIKRMDVADFLRVPLSGIFYAKLDSDDAVKQVAIIPNKFDLVAYCDRYALRININDVPHLKRNSKGNKVMNTDDKMDGLAVINKKRTTHLVIITEKGYINKISVLALPITKRLKDPSNLIKLKRGDNIKFVLAVNNKDVLEITTKNNNYIFSVSDFEEGSSASTGNKQISAKTDIILKARRLSIEELSNKNDKVKI